jgi:Ca2+-binding RTX toxin-like protein
MHQSRNDTVYGGLNDDKIWGEAGADILRGEDGNDIVYSGDGNDKVYGGAGNDTLYGDGGTDTIYGDAGNDILKGGTGISKLYGDAGIDTAYYDPSTSDIDAIGSYLSSSYIEAEKVYIYNKTTDDGMPTQTIIWNPDVNVESHDQYIGFGNGSKTINVGYTEGNPELVVVGAGGLKYHGPDFGGTSRVTGTAVKDEFYGGYGNDIFKGGAGNDDFYIKGGDDLLISEAGDADTFFFSPDTYGANATITGFNGAGIAGGDTIHISDDGLGTLPKSGMARHSSIRVSLSHLPETCLLNSTQMEIRFLNSPSMPSA